MSGAFSVEYVQSSVVLIYLSRIIIALTRDLARSPFRQCTCISSAKTELLGTSRCPSIPRTHSLRLLHRPSPMPAVSPRPRTRASRGRCLPWASRHRLRWPNLSPRTPARPASRSGRTPACPISWPDYDATSRHWNASARAPFKQPTEVILHDLAAPVRTADATTMADRGRRDRSPRSGRRHGNEGSTIPSGGTVADFESRSLLHIRCVTTVRSAAATLVGHA